MASADLSQSRKPDSHLQVDSLINSNKLKRYCVIGAGPAGLTATKNLLQSGFHVDCYDSQESVGGIWNFANGRSSIHESTRMISSKRLTEFCDFRMPREYPHYPGHRQALEYLKSYASHFKLGPHIHLGQSVESVRPAERAGQELSLIHISSPRDKRQSRMPSSA